MKSFAAMSIGDAQFVKPNSDNRDRLLFLFGLRRGGTNIAWNLLQSNPEITSPIFELGELCWRSPVLRWSLSESRRGIKKRIAKAICLATLKRWKSRTLQHEDNRYMSPHRIYRKHELRNTLLCVKGVDEEVQYADVIRGMFPQVPVIGLVRNGYAVAEGKIRRGESATQAGTTYTEFAEAIDRLRECHSQFKLVRFEDLLEDPLKTSRELFAFANVAQTDLSDFRLKSKRFVRENGAHEVSFGVEGRKVWFTAEELLTVLSSNVNSSQQELLSLKHRKEFEQYGRRGMELLGYTISQIGESDAPMTGQAPS